MLSNKDIIPGLHENLFIMLRELQNGFHVTSEVETLILKTNSTEIYFHKKMEKHGGKGFLLNTKLYKSANDVAL